MKRVISVLSILFMTALFTNAVFAQCEGFAAYPGGEQQAKVVHVKYRDFMKQKNYDEARPLWEEIFKSSPAGSEWHYVDGVKLLEADAKAETDKEAQKAKYQKVADLYDNYIECFGQKKKKNGSTKEGDLLRKKALVMMYKTKAPTKDVYDVFTKSIELEGNNTRASVFKPYLYNAVKLFKKEELSKERMREIYDQMLGIANYNAENGKSEKVKTNYKAAVTKVLKAYEPIEYKVFDCAYFVEKFKPEFGQHYNDIEYMKSTMLRNLKKAECEDGNEFVDQIIARIKAIQDSTRVSNRDNTTWGHLAYKEGDKEKAISFYKKAIAEDPISADKKHDLSLRIAKVYLKQKRFQEAKSMALQAAGFSPNSGEPYIVIGDAYMAGSSKCGGTFERQAVAWAALDKYAKAKSIDPSVASKASDRIGRYSAYVPTKEDLFQRTMSNGQSYRVGCWIQETTTVRAR